MDLDEHYTINYSICDDPTSVCFQQYNVTESCEPEQELERIVKAKLIDHNGNKHTLDVLDDRKGFTVRKEHIYYQVGLFNIVHDSFLCLI